MAVTTDDRFYHVDGDLVRHSEATVSVRDRGFMYGDAAFETLRAYGGSVFRWEAHADRLETTCETLGFLGAIPDRSDLRARIDETLSANECADAYVRLSITRGVQPGKLTPDSAVDPTVVVIVKPLERGGLAGEPVWDGPATVETVQTRKIPDSALPSNIKTHNYLNGILARLEMDNGDETLLCDTEGNIAEGATSNVFFLSEGTLYTPTTDQSLLPGVTRATVLDIAREEGVPVETGRYTREDLIGAEEAFLTNTTWEIRPIETLDGHAIGGGHVTARLQEAFDRRIEQRFY